MSEATAAVAVTARLPAFIRVLVVQPPKEGVGKTGKPYKFQEVDCVALDENGEETNSGSTYCTSKAPGAYTDTVDFQAFQLGVYAEVGRAWAALGVEHASETTRSYVVQPDRTWAVQPEAKKAGAGAYLKTGLKLSACSIYVGYGSRSEFVAGLGLHF